MFAERFITIAPEAGCPLGIPGNNRWNSGPTTVAMNSVTPPFSAIFMNPSHSDMMPVRPIESSNAVLEESNSDVTTACSASGWPRSSACNSATTNAISSSAAQIQFSMQRRMSAGWRQRQGRDLRRRPPRPTRGGAHSALRNSLA